MAIDQLKSLFTEPGIPEDQARKVINAMDHFDIARLLHQLTEVGLTHWLPPPP